MENEDLAGNQFVESTVMDSTTEPSPAALTAESVAARFLHLKSIHPNLRVQMPNGFTQSTIGSYPMYQQPLVAPFVAHDGRALQAMTVITLTKAEWENRNLDVYNQRRLEAMDKLLGWVEAMVVPMRSQGEDQVKVAEWGEKKVEEEAQATKSSIELTDL